MANAILFVHGRSTKPAKAALWRLWLAATRHGIARDHPARLDAFTAARKEFVYYGDVSNAYLRSRGTSYDEARDVAGRKLSLQQLRALPADAFTKENYERLPGKNAALELLADVGASTLGALRIAGKLIEAAAPDIHEYWNFDSAFGTDVRFPMIAPLQRAMDRADRILVVSHSLGTLIAYDTLWKFSRAGEYRPRYTDKVVDTWITLGSPLGDETVKRKLKGARAGGKRRFPANVRHWHNVAAEDDYISHDGTLADDYRAMLDAALVDSITDHRIYNLALRDGRSNPHHGLGYLVHPTVARLIADWLGKTS
ncbi:MAG: hypothetical protein OEX13_18395 [Gammaproteobacteria bacterium]|nr:hypothetical protein [Gammaproteobacteria bacterium]